FGEVVSVAEELPRGAGEPRDALARAFEVACVAEERVRAGERERSLARKVWELDVDDRAVLVDLVAELTVFPLEREDRVGEISDARREGSIEVRGDDLGERDRRERGRSDLERVAFADAFVRAARNERRRCEE